jgi:hypothetical protein
MSRFHHVLKEFLDIGECINDGFAHGVVSGVVVFHEPFGYGEETVFVPG